MIHAFGSILMAIPTGAFQWLCVIGAAVCCWIIGRAKPQKHEFQRREKPIDLYGSYDYFSRED